MTTFRATLLVIFISTVVFLGYASYQIFGTIIPGYVPGESFAGQADALTDDEQKMKVNLQRNLSYLTEKIGQRSIAKGTADEAADYIKSELVAMGYAPTLQTYDVKGDKVSNVIATLKGTSRPDEVLVIGAHYDTAAGTVGAADVVSGGDLSDHKSFWDVGYPAIMVTDTAFFRNKHYHTKEDTIDKIDFDSLTRVLTGLQKSVEKVAN